MEVHLDQEAEDREDQVTYLYKYEHRCGARASLTIQTAFEPAVVVLVLVAGEALLSFMGSLANEYLSCAALNGIDATIVDRANYLAHISVKGEDLVTACAEISEKEEDDLKDAVNVPDRICLILSTLNAG